MKHSVLALLLASLVLTAGCSDDDDEVITPEPPIAVADIDSADTLVLELTGFDGPSGELAFTLTDADGVRLNGAESYTIHYIGLPSELSRKPKSWRRWHAFTSFLCNSPASEDCDGVLQPVDQLGNYRFTAEGLDWDAMSTPEAVQTYKVAIQIHGALASNPVELIVAN